MVSILPCLKNWYLFFFDSSTHTMTEKYGLKFSMVLQTIYQYATVGFEVPL